MDVSFVRKNGFSWHEEVTAALERVDQGTVLRSVPLVYAANGAYAVLPHTKHALNDRNGGVQLVEMDAMVTSQTCDIRGPGGRRSPFLTVVPVYAATELQPDLTPAAIAKTGYLVRVDGPAFDQGLYVADLRFETTVEKSIVVNREAVDGCAGPEQRSLLAKKLAEVRRRAAFDPRLERILLKPLEGLFTREIAPDDVYEVRVFGDPSITRADRARLIIVCERNADVDAIRATVGRWYDDIREMGEDLTFLPLQVESVERITLDSVRDAVPVFFRELSADPTEL